MEGIVLCSINNQSVDTVVSEQHSTRNASVIAHQTCATCHCKHVMVLRIFGV